MLAAPNSTKEPTITAKPRLISTLPFSIPNPTDATAITATSTAIVPSIELCNHDTAATTALDPDGSLRGFGN